MAAVSLGRQISKQGENLKKKVKQTNTRTFQRSASETTKASRDHRITRSHKQERKIVVARGLCLLVSQTFEEMDPNNAVELPAVTQAKKKKVVKRKWSILETILRYCALAVGLGLVGWLNMNANKFFNKAYTQPSVPYSGELKEGETWADRRSSLAAQVKDEV